MATKLLSFVIPCYRSEKTIAKVIEEIDKTVAEREEFDYEVICVNDCSPDNVLDVLYDLADKNPKVKVINFAKNKGKHAAILAARHYVSGDYVVDIDDDYQSPVYNLWKLVDPIEAGLCDVAAANYFEKKHTFVKRFGSKVNIRMGDVMLERPHGLHTDNFNVMKRFVSDEMIKYTNPYPYYEGLIFMVTHNIQVVMMEQRERGDDNATGFTFKKSFDLLINGLTAFSVKPLRVSMFVGTMFAILGFLYGIYILLGKFVWHTVTVLGYASLSAIILFTTGVLMLMLGMIGEYIGRIYISMNNFPQYTVKETKNIDKE